MPGAVAPVNVARCDTLAAMKTLLSLILFVAASTIYAQTNTLTFPNVGSGPNRQTDIQVLAGETLEILAWFPHLIFA